MVITKKLALAAVLALLGASPVLAATVHHPRAPVSRISPGVRASAQPRSGGTTRDNPHYFSRDYQESQGESEGFHGGN